MAGPHDHVEHLVERIIDVDRADADARHHHLVHALLGELDDPVDHLLLLLLDAALLGTGLHQQLQLLGREVAALRPLGAAQQADEQRADAGHEPHDRREEGLDEADRAGHQERQALGEVQRHGLRHQLADDDRGQRDDERDHHEGDGVGRRGAQVDQRDALEQVAEAIGEARGANGAGQEPEEGDRDLDRGQEAAGFVGQASGRSRGAAAVIGQLAEAVALDGDQGHLAGGEEAADEDEDDDNQEFHHRTRLSVVLLPSGMGGADCASSTGSGPARSAAGSPPQPVRRRARVCAGVEARSVVRERQPRSCPARRRA